MNNLIIYFLLFLIVALIYTIHKFKSRYYNRKNEVDFNLTLFNIVTYSFYILKVFIPVFRPKKLNKYKLNKDSIDYIARKDKLKFKINILVVILYINVILVAYLLEK